ncbi:MAG TPA: hypothetical protein VNZ44_11590 [Pyrinomonadaceae bacterium]|nr:hypothetical protein [Pyrinomonadaceae bacterium]
MKRRHYVLNVFLALCAALAGHALYGALVAPRTVEARAAAQPREDGWEYCAVMKAQTPGAVRLVYWIVYFKGEGVKVDPVEAVGVNSNSFGKAVAKLGDEGWEMVGEGPLGAPLDPRPGPSINAPSAYFFKRRKSD